MKCPYPFIQRGFAWGKSLPFAQNYDRNQPSENTGSAAQQGAKPEHRAVAAQGKGTQLRGCCCVVAQWPSAAGRSPSLEKGRGLSAEQLAPSAAPHWGLCPARSRPGCCCPPGQGGEAAIFPQARQPAGCNCKRLSGPAALSCFGLCRQRDRACRPAVGSPAVVKRQSCDCSSCGGQELKNRVFFFRGKLCEISLLLSLLLHY